MNHVVKEMAGRTFIFTFEEDELLGLDVFEEGQGQERGKTRTRPHPALDQVQEYLEGNRQTFDLDLKFRGSPFQVSVWRALTQIPYGHTSNYKAIARAISRPNAYRAVGTAIGQNPFLLVVPCHRVLRADGSLGGYRGGLDLKRFLLEGEGARYK